MDEYKCLYKFDAPAFRSEGWYRDLLRQARQFIDSSNMSLDCHEGESDRDCFNRHKATLLKDIDGVLNLLPFPDSLPPPIVRLEQCPRHMGTPMTLVLSASFQTSTTICPNCEDEKNHA